MGGVNTTMSTAPAMAPHMSTTPTTTLTPSADTVLDDRPEIRYDEGDHERFSHYVPKDKLTEAMVMGTPVIALCGKVWVPSRNPEKFPVCPACKEIWNEMNPNEGGDGGGE